TSKAEWKIHGYYSTWLLGDRGYALRSFLLSPLANPTTAGERLYNESHIRTRNVVERTFGCWKLATAVLHNICRKMNEEQPPDIVDINEEIDMVHETGTNHEDTSSTRREFISSYFDRLADNHII
ncbi:hypothetical protein HW555_002913, partial [Spodoptera exigua]